MSYVYKLERVDCVWKTPADSKDAATNLLMKP